MKILKIKSGYQGTLGWNADRWNYKRVTEESRENVLSNSGNDVLCENFKTKHKRNGTYML